MDINKFIINRPTLYHLTNENNLPIILKHGRIYSTNSLIEMSSNLDYYPIKRQRRPNHITIDVNGDMISIRDQRPISEKALQKCLTNNWTCADFYEFLNNRVFTWPTLDRLHRHYERYKNENPIIIALDTALLFETNPNPLFSRLNSGATRANSYLGGVPPSRGKETFLPAHLYENTITSVAEVTFEHELRLPENIEVMNFDTGHKTRLSVK